MKILMKARSALALFICTLVLSGCMSGGSRERFGTLLGATAGGIAGGAIGSNAGTTGAVAGTLVGALAGGAIGGAIGRSMDEEDRIAMRRASHQAIEENRPYAWRNPRNPNHYGHVYPMNPVRRSGYGRCRRVKQAIFIDGQAQTMIQTVCQNGHGEWSVVS